MLCEDGGETVLRPGDAANGKLGPKQPLFNQSILINRSERDAIFLKITLPPSDHAHYSNSDMQVVRTRVASMTCGERTMNFIAEVNSMWSSVVVADCCSSNRPNCLILDRGEAEFHHQTLACLAPQRPRT